MHPILFKIPLPHWKLPIVGELSAFPIYAYGVMLGLSLVVGWYISLSVAKADGLPRETMANNYVFTAICAIIGSRLLYIVTNLDEFKTWKDMLAIRSGGLVAYGGFLGGFLGSWYFCARRKIRLMAWADAAVPSLASGLLFTRIGCYMFGCDFGKPLSEKAPKWLIKLGTFPEWHYDHKAGKFLDTEALRTAYQDPAHQILSGSPAWVQHTESFPQVRDLHHSMPVHPTQLYESLAGLCLLGLLFVARKSVKKREAAGEAFFRGEIFVVFTFAYGVLRFLIEIFRDDIERKTYGPFVEPHILVPLALMGFALAFAFGLANIVPERSNLRTIARSVALLIPLGVFMIMKPSNKFELVEKVQLSTSQWIAIFTGIAVAVYYRFAYDNAVADPVAAADLGEGVPALLEAEAAAERGETPEEDKDTDEEGESEESSVAKKAKRLADDDDVPVSKAKKKSPRKKDDDEEEDEDRPVARDEGKLAKRDQKTVRAIPPKKSASDDEDEKPESKESKEDEKSDDGDGDEKAAKSEDDGDEKKSAKSEEDGDGDEKSTKSKSKDDEDEKKKDRKSGEEPEASA
jgi:phosphatidylglycerol:prolipoprotein diacylglycerol transferase